MARTTEHAAKTVKGGAYRTSRRSKPSEYVIGAGIHQRHRGSREGEGVPRC